jgi:hypothetical protein
MALAFSFFKKSGGDGKGSDSTTGNTPAAATPAAGAPDPARAKVFFEHARVKQETGSFDYALNLWLNGLCLDPNNVSALQSYFECVRSSGLSAPSKDLRAVVDKSTATHKAMARIMEWSFAQTSGEAATRAAVAMAELSMDDVSRWIAPRALAVVKQYEAKPRKDQFVRLMNVFIANEQYDYALNAGQGALDLDPGDIKLSNDLRDLAAMATMNKGGYENTGEAGGFRKNIRNADEQRRLEENAGLLKNENVLDRNVREAKAEYEARPTDKPSIKKYLATLTDRKTVEDIQTAIAVAEKAHVETQEYQFRDIAGKLRVRIGQARLKQLKAAWDAAPNDPAAKTAFLKAEAAQLELEVTELTASVAAYPTDMARKHDLAQRLMLAGKFEEAIAQFQQSKSDGRYKASSLAGLARAFKNIGWMEEAIGTLREAVAGNDDPNSEAGLELRYELTACLLAHGQSARDLPALEEADKLASAIAVQNIMFKDIRDVRTKIKAAITALRG